ncbi:MAG: hypothetical protein K9G76_09455 [Bacteroidales bacterium]|nr:hypothetical protein [Bacteroidales bacterium]MCF8403776.1 hypothetical protein [Bacteroidales bacterium]
MKTLYYMFFALAIMTFIALCLLPLKKIYAQTDIDNILELTIVGNGYSDQTFVVIIPSATIGFDSDYDAYKLMGIYAAPQLYSKISCCNLSVNALPELYTNMKVQLGFRVGANTTYTISAFKLYSFGADTNVFLVDTKLGQMQNLMQDSTYTFFGETTDDETRFEIYYNYPLKPNIKVWLDGPYNGVSMATQLNTEGVIPLAQPFSGSPWNYAGTESVGSIPNSNIVDWVLIEIRDASDPSLANSTTVTERQACFILSDGSIVGIDGNSLPEFTEPVTQKVFAVVYTRNHIPIMTATPLLRSGDESPYDFTTSAGQAYGSLAQKDLGGGVFGMYGGDSNADGTIDGNDKVSFWSILAGKSGYLSADFNFDGQINNPDKNQVWLPNQGMTIQVP